MISDTNRLSRLSQREPSANKPDIYVCGYPCQPWSKAGPPLGWMIPKTFNILMETLRGLELEPGPSPSYSVYWGSFVS